MVILPDSLAGFISRSCLWFSVALMDLLLSYSEMEAPAPMEEIAETEETPAAPEGEAPTKYELILCILLLSP